MVSIPLTNSTAATIVGSADYLEKHGVPLQPDDLTYHSCIGYRFVSSGRLYRWPLAKGKSKFEFEVGGSLAFNDGEAVRAAALDGLGLCYVFRSKIEEDVRAGRLIPVLTDWTPDLPGFSLYYPDRSRTAPAFRAMIEHLKSQ